MKSLRHNKRRIKHGFYQNYTEIEYNYKTLIASKILITDSSKKIENDEIAKVAKVEEAELNDVHMILVGLESIKMDISIIKDKHKNSTLQFKIKNSKTAVTLDLYKLFNENIKIFKDYRIPHVNPNGGTMKGGMLAAASAATRGILFSARTLQVATSFARVAASNAAADAIKRVNDYNLYTKLKNYVDSDLKIAQDKQNTEEKINNAMDTLITDGYKLLGENEVEAQPPPGFLDKIKKWLEVTYKNKLTQFITNQKMNFLNALMTQILIEFEGYSNPERPDEDADGL